MGHDAVKLELIEWLARLDDEETIEYIKIVKDSKSETEDWWNSLSDEQKTGIESGLKDVDDGNVFPIEQVELI